MVFNVKSRYISGFYYFNPWSNTYIVTSLDIGELVMVIETSHVIPPSIQINLKHQMIIYTVEDLAIIFKVNIETINRAARKGELTGAKIGDMWRFTQDNIDDWIATRTPSTTRVQKAAKERKKRKVAKILEQQAAFKTDILDSTEPKDFEYQTNTNEKQ